MILLLSQDKNRKILPMKLKNFVHLSLVAIMLVLTSCGWSLREKENSLNIYQPPTLHLRADQPIKTVEGVYTPQTDELWHSDARFRKLESEQIR